MHSPARVCESTDVSLAGLESQASARPSASPVHVSPWGPVLLSLQPT